MPNLVNMHTDPTKLVTSGLRVSYANVYEPKAINGGTPKYSATLIIPKSDEETLTKVRLAIKAAYLDGAVKLKGNGQAMPALESLNTPLRDGDLQRPHDPAYQNAYFIKATNLTAPGLVDADCNPITERSEFYSGVYARASINFYAYNRNGNRGIACGLQNLQKLHDGPPLGTKPNPADDFANSPDHDGDSLIGRQHENSPS